jgi:hypothetical protein
MTTNKATPNQMDFSPSPVDPAALVWAEYWYPLAWKGLLAAGVTTAIGACAGIAFLLLQWRTSTIREQQSDWRTSVLETQAKRAEADLLRAQADIAKANARVAEAEQKAAEANLEIARIRAPRVLSIQQQRRIADALRQFREKKFDTAVVQGDPEALSLLEMIEAAVRAADWMQINWHDTVAGAIQLSRPGLPTVGNISLNAGVVIQFETEEKDALGEAATTLASALSAEGIATIVSENFFVPKIAANRTAIHIMVAKKF